MAVLAGVAVAHQNVLARQGPGLVWDAAIFEQPDHGRHRKSPPGGMNRGRGNLFRRGDALQNQHQGAASRADVDGLVAGVQHEYWFMKPIQTGHAVLPVNAHLWSLRWSRRAQLMLKRLLIKLIKSSRARPLDNDA